MFIADCTKPRIKKKKRSTISSSTHTFPPSIKEEEILPEPYQSTNFSTKMLKEEQKDIIMYHNPLQHK